MKVIGTGVRTGHLSMVSCFVMVVMVVSVNLESAPRAMRLCGFVVLGMMLCMSPGHSVDLETSRFTGIVKSICSTLVVKLIFF